MIELGGEPLRVLDRGEGSFGIAEQPLIRRQLIARARSGVVSAIEQGLGGVSLTVVERETALAVRGARGRAPHGGGRGPKRVRSLWNRARFVPGLRLLEEALAPVLRRRVVSLAIGNEPEAPKDWKASRGVREAVSNVEGEPVRRFDLGGRGTV